PSIFDWCHQHHCRIVARFTPDSAPRGSKVPPRSHRPAIAGRSLPVRAIPAALAPERAELAARVVALADLLAMAAQQLMGRDQPAEVVRQERRDRRRGRAVGAGVVLALLAPL